jgi:hypothetical protein
VPSAARHRSAAERRASEPAQLHMLRYGRAWAQALQTARRLVADFGATRVAAVGGLLRPERFGSRGEIELVVWGLRADVLPPAAAPWRPDPIPVRIHDGDRMGPALARRVRAEAVELARRAE